MFVSRIESAKYYLDFNVLILFALNDCRHLLLTYTLVSLSSSLSSYQFSAKIWRIKMVWKAAQSFIAKTVTARDVGLIIVGVLVVQAIVLTCWQVIDPMKWQREVIYEDANGYPLKSVGACQSENMLRFLIPLVIIDGGMLVYALYLCYVTRKVSSEYQEVSTMRLDK